jgi:peroxiredoxin (alkyl hydroperoxide reductase subunit C)
VDSEYAHLAWTRMARSEGGLGPTQLPLLADTTHALAKAFGVHLDEAGVALRGLFIMDPKAVVRHATVNDLGIGRSVDETLRVLQAIQFTDKHGEVCPAGWQQGSPTIKPSPEESRNYFARLSAAASVQS